MLIEKYIQVTDRLQEAAARGRDVDHLVDERDGLWAMMNADDRREVRMRMAELKSAAA